MARTVEMQDFLQFSPGQEKEFREHFKSGFDFDSENQVGYSIFLDLVNGTKEAIKKRENGITEIGEKIERLEKYEKELGDRVDSNGEKQMVHEKILNFKIKQKALAVSRAFYNKQYERIKKLEEKDEEALNEILRHIKSKEESLI
jgi:hypothetical protein